MWSISSQLLTLALSISLRKINELIESMINNDRANGLILLLRQYGDSSSFSLLEHIMAKKRTRPKIYRKIYEQYYGPIPKDEEGRTFEIHHKDGDSTNNNPENLVALSIKDHYEVHYNQGDWGAAFMIAKKMKMSPETTSNLIKLAARELVENGTHHFLKKGEDHPSHKSTLYNFIHKNGQLITCTMYELRTKFNLNAGNLGEVISGNRKSVSGWRINSPLLSSLDISHHGNTNQTIHCFVHKNGQKEHCTMYEMRIKFDLNAGNLSEMLAGRKKSVKGWTINSLAA